MIKSVIDIGTNTAHLLIGEVDHSVFTQSILRQREYTYLGENGLLKIHEEPLKRLYKALKLFAELLKEHGSESLIIVATDALRSASNGPEIQREITKILNKKPLIISGNTEALLIKKGVELSLSLIPQNYLIMDIGGGSVEFIHVVNGVQVLLESLPLGISRLYKKCKSVDVMTPDIVKDLKKHISEISINMIASTRRFTNDLTLIGSAGTFEIFLPKEHIEDLNIAHSNIDIKMIKERYEEVLYMDLNDRKDVSWLPSVRTKYIVVALILMQSIIEETMPQRLIVSKYALKEGALVTDSSTIQPNF